MAKKKGNQKQQKKSSGNKTAQGSIAAGGIFVDPERVRFQYSKIRPIFSGCGRKVEETLQEIREGKVQASDLPPIQVLVGPVDKESGQPWYFSLNNRRLWVLKRCREEGLLPNNQVWVRVRKPKSEQEIARYTLENCVLEAKIIQEKVRSKREPNCHDKQHNYKNEKTTSSAKSVKELTTLVNAMQHVDYEDDNDDTSDSDEDSSGPPNRFSALG